MNGISAKRTNSMGKRAFLIFTLVVVVCMAQVRAQERAVAQKAELPRKPARVSQPYVASGQVLGRLSTQHYDLVLEQRKKVDQTGRLNLWLFLVERAGGLVRDRLALNHELYQGRLKKGAIDFRLKIFEDGSALALLGLVYGDGREHSENRFRVIKVGLDRLDVLTDLNLNRVRYEGLDGRVAFVYGEAGILLDQVYEGRTFAGVVPGALLIPLKIRLCAGQVDVFTTLGQAEKADLAARFARLKSQAIANDPWGYDQASQRFYEHLTQEFERYLGLNETCRAPGMP